MIEQLKETPHELLLLVGMLCFSIYWKKSRWPNRWFPIINIVVPMVVYPLLEVSISDEPYKRYTNPVVVLSLYGAVIAVATVAAHNYIIAYLRKRFPNMEFPDDDPAEPVNKSPTTETKNTEPK